MAWIKVIQPEEATGELRKEYDAALERAGYIAQVLRIQSLNPKSLHISIEFYKWIMKGPSGLSRAEREMLATVVSQVNHCFY
ncbi:carboxymuconolactone decarboxylase family protein [bacterium]|nr:carboxymuconolactone decarboxylase family protein [bacterium]MCI0604229.1 carboxymuconolactone decarboxylase family protein [bacterium]